MPCQPAQEPTEEQVQAAAAELDSKQQEVDFDIKDYVVDHIVGQFKGGEFVIPTYQRRFVWSASHRMKFIESVLLGLPIPLMFLAEREKDGRFDIVDGAQRIQTLVEFLSDRLVLEDLEQLPHLNGFSFSNLPDRHQRKLKNRSLRLIILEARTSTAIRREIFDRINTQGLPANGAEIRRGAFAGPFMDFIRECAEDTRFISLCPIPAPLRERRADEELVTRFFAFSEDYLHFRHDVERFLDAFAKSHQQEFDRERLKTEFDGMLDFVQRHFPNGFGKGPKSKSTPHVRFEAIAVGTNLALRQRPGLVPVPISWLESQEFLEHTRTHASNSLPRLKGRIEFVRDKLLS